MSTLRCRNLSRTFEGRVPVEALRRVTLEVADGTLLAVLGPSGCGKTTLLRTLAGVEPPDRGTIHLGDKLLDGPGVHLTPERRAIGLVPQEGALFPHLDAARNVSFGLQRLPRPQRRVRVAEMLDLVGLPGFEKRRPHQLSGGQQQRVALARALAPNPEVVLLDEPFSALDTGLRASLRAQVVETLRDAGTTSLLVTHDQVEALTMADTVAVMREGEIIQVGAAPDVYRRPADSWTAGFLGDAVLVPGTRVVDDRVRCVFGDLSLAPDFDHHPGRSVSVFCRPEQVQLVPGGHDPASSGTDARVDAVRFLGPDLLVDLTLDGGPGASTSLTARWPSSLLPAPGDRVKVGVSGSVLAYEADDETHEGTLDRLGEDPDPIPGDATDDDTADDDLSAPAAPPAHTGS